MKGAVEDLIFEGNRSGSQQSLVSRRPFQGNAHKETIQETIQCEAKCPLAQNNYPVETTSRSQKNQTERSEDKQNNSHLPDGLVIVDNPTTGEKKTEVSGALRDGGVQVGREDRCFARRYPKQIENMPYN
jgi:hypothetical protein